MKLKRVGSSSRLLWCEHSLESATLKRTECRIAGRLSFDKRRQSERRDPLIKHHRCKIKPARSIYPGGLSDDRYFSSYLERFSHEQAAVRHHLGRRVIGLIQPGCEHVKSDYIAVSIDRYGIRSSQVSGKKGGT